MLINSNVDKIQLDGGFSTYFVMNLNGKTSDDPADGLCFVVQNNSDPELGGYGVGLGFYNIENSIGVEFDIWENIGVDDSTGGTFFDPNANHVAILTVPMPIKVVPGQLAETLELS